MKTTSEKAAEALELLPEEMREPAVAYLLEQAERFRVLKEQIGGILRSSCAKHEIRRSDSCRGCDL